MSQLIFALQTEVRGIELPMSPEFVDVGATIAAGCFAEWRHTHVFYRDDDYERAFSPKIRGHIKAAERVADIVICDHPHTFAFDRAIKSTSESDLVQRQKLSLMLHAQGKAKSFIAQTSKGVSGGAFLVFDHRTAYLFHSWFERDVSRGIPSLLIRECIHWAFKVAQLTRFDFEGSIIASIDQFMTGFGARIEPYSYLYWDTKAAVLLRRIQASLEMGGRCK